MDDLAKEFHQAMLQIYSRTVAEVPLLAYTSITFGVEIRQYGGLETAKRCIHSKELGAGLTALSQIHRLDLSVEALIRDNPKWHSLFSEEELAICTARLKAFNYSKLL